MIDLEKIKKEVAHDMLWHERNITKQTQRLRLYQRVQGQLRLRNNKTMNWDKTDISPLREYDVEIDGFYVPKTGIYIISYDGIDFMRVKLLPGTYTKKDVIRIWNETRESKV